MRSRVGAIVVSLALSAGFSTAGVAAGESNSDGAITLDSSGLEIVGSEVLQAGAMSDELRSAWAVAYTLAMDNRDDFAYPWVDVASGTMRVAPTSDRGRSLAESAAGSFEAGTHVKFEDSSVSVADLDRLGDALTRLNAAGWANADLIWMTEPDHLNNRIIVTIAQANPRLMNSLAVEFGTTRLAVRIAPAPLESGPSNRDDDYPLFYGGARIQAPVGACTTGFAWSASAGRSMVFAGHCALAGGLVSYPSYVNVGSVQTAVEENWSKTTGTTYLTGQSVYRGDIGLIRYYTESATERVYTGGTASSTFSWVTSYGPYAKKDDQICANGASDGENCGKVVATGVNIHYTKQGAAVEGNNVWLRNAVKAEPSNFNQCPIGGDSGGPLYKRGAQATVVGKGILSGAADFILGCEFYYTDIMDASNALPGFPQTTSN